MDTAHARRAVLFPFRRRVGFVGRPHLASRYLAALIGQLAHRRLSTDDGVSADVVADFVVSLVLDGLRPRRP